MKHLKALVAVALVVAMVVGLFPFDFAGRPISIQPAVAAAQPEKNDATWTNLLSDAEAAASEGRIMSSGEWQYVRLPGTNWAAITGYTGEQQGSLAVPDQLDGFDVVCIRSSLSNDLTNLTSIEIPGNVLIIGEAAFPRGTTIAAVNASYAQTYARNNGYAFQNRSKLDFCSGVIDLSDIRAENFVRVSEHEVWLRELEAKRLTEGSLFFLADPNDLYQISYYQVSAINEPSGGFVTIECTTPSVDRILKYYEANNQQMVLDTSSVVLYDGTTLESSAKTRSLSGTFGGDSVKTGFKLNKSINLGGSNPGKLTFSLNYGTSFKGSYKVGLFTTNETEVEETAEYSVSVSYSLKEESSYTNGGRLDSEMKHLLASAEKYRMPGVTYSTVNPATLDQPFMQGTVVSIYGFVNVTVTLRFVCELKGSVSFTYSATTVTKTKTKEGSDSSTTSKTISRSFSGSAKGEFKIGVKASLEIYIFCVRIAALELFAGVKATASLEVSRTWDTVKNSEAYGDIDQLDILRQMATGQDTIVLPEDVNINMIDCVKLAINWVAEVEYSLGVGKSITAVSGKHTLLDINLITFHLHLSNNEYEPEPYTDDWENKDTYTYTLGGPKDNMHVDVNCPYDYKTVKIVLPYDHNRIAFIDRRVPSGFLQDEPTLSADDCANLGYKFIGFHTDASLDANSLVTSWPQKIMQDTTYYVEAAKMHKVSLIGSDRKAISGASTLVFQSNDDANPISLIDRNSYAATGEYLKLPSTMSDGTPVDYWILVNSKTDLTPVGFSEATDTWKIMPGSLYLVTEEMGDNLFFCAVTGQDVALYFHTCIQGATYIRYTRRGGKVALPGCDVTVSRFAFSGWADSNGTAVDGPISVGINSANALHYYAVWTPSNTVTAVDLANPHIGSTDPGYGGSIPEDPKTAFSYSVSYGNATITGYYGNYTHLRVPSKIEIDEHTSYTVTGIDSGAFQDNKDLVSIVLPWTISSIGSEAFSGCTSLRLIDMSATSATLIPVRFAYGCIMLQCVRINGQKITGIEPYAFYGCEKLDSLRLNARIGNNAFQNCTGITSVELGAGVTQIGYSAFAGCTSIKSLNVPDSVTSLGNYFIGGCTSIETLILEPRITSLTSSQMNIGDGSKLKSLTLGGTVTTLGDQVFANGTYGFTQLTDLTIETILSNVGSYILRGSSIESLTLSFPNTAQSGTIYSYNVLAGMTSLKTVRIDSGRIGSYMFSGNTSLETVVIGSGVSAIEAYAFNGCSGLLRVNYEGTPSLSSIGNCAFNNCTSLVEFMIPSSVNVYGQKIFYGCKNLEKLTIEGFDGMVLVDSNYPGYSIGSTATFTIGADSELKELVIGDGVVKIGNNVFSNAGVGFKKLTTVTFGSGLQEVGNSAFSGSAIRNVTFTGDVSIGTNVFENTGIEEVRFLGNANIGNCAFYRCTSLKSVLISGGTIGNRAFAECTNLESAILKDGVTSIGILAFENCNSLTSFEIPDSVTFIGAFLLKGCNNVTYLKIGGGISDLSVSNKSSFGTDTSSFVIDDEGGSYRGLKESNPFYIGTGSQLNRIVISEGVTSIGNSFFSNYRGNGFSYIFPPGYPKLTEVSLPGSLKSIGSYAFKNAPKLTDVVFPKSIQFIGSSAFESSALRRIEIPSGTVSSRAFYGIKTLEEVVIGGDIGDRAFAECSGLKRVILKEGVTSIGILAFENCNSLTSFEIPDSVTSIGGHMIKGCNNVTYLKIGGGISDLDINNKSFKTDLRSFYIVDDNGAHYGSVGSYPFYIGTGSQLNRIVISEGVTSIGDYMFSNSGASGYPKLTEVSLPSSLKSIGSCAFAYSPQLTDVVFPKSIQFIGYRAFRGSALRRIEIPSGTVSKEAFRDIKTLEEVVIGGDIGDRAFAECSGLKRVILKEGVSSIGILAFENCNSLTSFEIPDSVTSIGAFMLKGCNNVTYLKIGGGISDLSINNKSFRTDTSRIYMTDEEGSHDGSMGSNPFYIGAGSQLKRIVISEGVTSIGNYMFSNFYSGYSSNYTKVFGYTRLTDVSFPDSLKSIGYNAFTNAHQLTDVVFPKSMQFVGSFAFSNSALRRIEMPSGNVSSFAFSGIKTLEEVVIGGDIGDRAFADCSGLKRVILKEGVTSIGSRAFENCTSLKSLEIPDSVTSLGALMLNGCNNLTTIIQVFSDMSTTPEIVLAA